MASALEPGAGKADDNPVRRSLPSLAPVLVLAVAVAPAWAQPDDDSDAPVAWAGLTLERGKPTRLVITGRPQGADVAGALARIGGQPAPPLDHGDRWSQWSCTFPAPTRHGLVLRQELSIAPLLDTLRAAGQKDLLVLVHHPKAGSVTLSGATVYYRQPGLLNASISTEAPEGPLVVELGWRRADVARVAGALGLAMLLPLLAGLLIWRRSFRRDRTPEAWLVPACQLQAIVMAGLVAWMVAIEGSRANELADFALFSGTRPLFGTRVFFFFAFLPVAWALGAMLRANTRRLRGFDPHPRGLAGFLGSARAMLSLLLLMTALSAFGVQQLKLGVFALLAAIVSGVLLPGPRGPLATNPQALSTGTLRDRLFELAHRAGVKLRELYVAPMRAQRMANAFAISGGTVMLTDELLDRMSRREVDAVLAHEVTHLEHHHPQKALLSAIAMWGVIVGVGLPLGIPYVIPAGLGLAWLTWLFMARRFEFAADAGAAALTSDPEAVISGLGQLAKLNQAPLAWGRRLGWLITHPTTAARCMAVGRRAGLAPARVKELLANGLPSEGRYGGPERPGEEERVFSTPWKSATVARLAMVLLMAAVATPALTWVAVRGFGVELPHVVAILAGAVLALGGMMLAQDMLAARGMSRLETAVRSRVGATEGGLFVALSPGDRPRIYEGFHDWDLGVLDVGSDCLIYRGEQVSLELPRAAVRSIEVGARAPSWIAAPRAVVRWKRPEGDAAVMLRPAGCRRVSAITGGSRALAARLEEWRSAGGAGTSQGPGPAGIGPVTARTPAEASAPRDLPALIVLLGLFSAAAAFLAGFDFWRGIDVFAGAFLGVMAMRWPAMTAREPESAGAGTVPEERRAA